jgi:hypothetical protein
MTTGIRGAWWWRGGSEVLPAFFANIVAKPRCEFRHRNLATARPEGAPPIRFITRRTTRCCSQSDPLTVSMLDVPASADESVTAGKLKNGFYRVVACFGFMDAP